MLVNSVKKSINGSFVSFLLSIWKPLTFLFVIIVWAFANTSGHNWGGDFSQYIHHAMNLIDGKNYNDTGYISNQFAYVGPPSYPPVLPFTLAPLYALFGFNLFALKFVGIFAFIIAAYLALSFDNKSLSSPYQFVFILILAFNPYYLEQKDEILSDYLFVLLSYITLIVLQKRYVKNQQSVYIDTKNTNWVYAFLLGLLIYLTYETREVGLVLIPAILCFELFHFRKITFVTIAALAFFVLLVNLQKELIQPVENNTQRNENISQLSAATATGSGNTEVSNFDYINLGNIKTMAIFYLKSAWSIWPDSNEKIHIRIFSQVAIFIFYSFFIAGFIKALLVDRSLIEVFVLGYVSVVLLFGSTQGLRYLMPIIPLCFLYAFKFHQDLMQTKFRKIMMVIAVAFIGSTLISITSTTYNPRPERGITGPEAKALFNFVKTSTTKESVFVFDKPRVLALLTDRQASSIPNTDDTDFLIRYMNAIGANYYINSSINDDGWSLVLHEVKFDVSSFNLVFSNQYFQVYKLLKK